MCIDCLRRWRRILPVFASSLALVVLFYSFSRKFLGWYYFLTVLLFVLVVYLHHLQRRFGVMDEWLSLGLRVAIVTTLFSILTLCVQGWFQYSVITHDNPVCLLQSFGENCWLLKIHKSVSTHRDVRSALGLGLGSISTYVFWVGHSYEGVCESAELPRTLMTSVSLMSVVMAILTFALQKEAFYELVGHVYPVSILLLGVFFLSLGLLTATLRATNQKALMRFAYLAGLAISFAVGFVWGDLAIPFGRTPMVGPQGTQIQFPLGQPMYTISPGSYFFMAMALVTLGITARMSFIGSLPSGFLPGLKEKVRVVPEGN